MDSTSGEKGKRKPSKNNECMPYQRRHPDKVKEALISPIPKGKEKEGVLSKLRPIALLEAPRKLFTKILNDRMTEILTEKKILSELNWAGLPGGSTREPISLLNSCMEHANDTRKELWIVFQDMRKAFDSVSKEGLKRAMERIGTPKTLVNIINSLMRGRFNKVILKHRLTK